MLQLTRIKGGGFDLVAQAADDAHGQTARTVVYATLFTDAQAPAAVEPDGFAARGWWAAPQSGTGLWYVRRQALDDAAREQARQMVDVALAQAVGLTDVSVVATAARNVSAVELAVSGKHNGQSFLMNIALVAPPYDLRQT